MSRIFKISPAITLILLLLARTTFSPFSPTNTEAAKKKPAAGSKDWALIVSLNDADFQQRGIFRQLKQSIAKAEKADTPPSHIVFILNIHGDQLLLPTARFAVDTLLNTNLKTISYVKNTALNSGAIIALASDHIHMSPTAIIGASLPDKKTSTSDTEKNGKKIKTNSGIDAELSARLRIICQKKNRSLKLAKAFFSKEKKFKLKNFQYEADTQNLALTAQEAADKKLLADSIESDTKAILKKHKLHLDSPSWDDEKSLAKFYEKKTKIGQTTQITKAAEHSTNKKKSDIAETDQEKLTKKTESKFTISKDDQIKLDPNREKIYTDKIVVIRVGEKDLIRKPRFRFMRRALKEIENDKASAVIFYVDTPGGLAWETGKLMLDEMQDISIPSYAYVKKAISAGALIASATDEIYMNPSSVIGAAAVVSSMGGDVGENMEKKIYSAFRAQIRSICKQKGRRWQVVEAFMDKSVEVVIDGETISAKDELLSLDAEQATRVYSDGKALLAKGLANSVEDLIAKENLKGEIIEAKPKGLERIAAFLASISAVLLLLAIAGAYMEAQAPGFGVPGAVAITCISLFFFGHYVDKLQGVFGMVVIFLIGVLFLIVELFIIPGTLIFGLAGILFIGASLVLTMADFKGVPIPESKGDNILPNLPGFDALLDPMLQLAIAIVGAAILIAILIRYLPETRFMSSFILSDAINSPLANKSQNVAIAEKNNTAFKTHNDLVGKKGVSISQLRPTGKAEIDGRIYDVSARDRHVEKGEKITVVDCAEGMIHVEKIS